MTTPAAPSPPERAPDMIGTSGCDAVVVVDEVCLLGVITAGDVVAAVAPSGAK